MNVTCVGGGPAGLMFAILASRAGHRVTVLEQRTPAESFGWGVVFWDSLLKSLDAHDPQTAEVVRREAYRYTDQIVTVRGADVRLPSYGYSMGRRRLLEILGSEAERAGATFRKEGFADDPNSLAADLVVAGDGVNSGLRDRRSFGSERVRGRNKFIWLGTDKEFTSFTFPFVDTPAGWVWGHAYGYADGASTFVVETTPETWSGLGFATLDGTGTIRRLEQLFAESLDGHHLQLRTSPFDGHPWTEFVEVRNRRWRVGNVALLGDAAHTTHFTIGSGTRLAMEDAMALADALASEPDVDGALRRYDEDRREELRGVQRVARRSARWFERVPRYIDRPAPEFATLMENRRSPVMAHLPVGAYLRLTGTAANLPMIEAPLRRLLSKL
jgi:2-polyprenyl-6-methoxyphenol hydroxylase-like FAD-dependent oxidoreductase